MGDIAAADDSAAEVVFHVAQGYEALDAEDVSEVYEGLESSQLSAYLGAYVSHWQRNVFFLSFSSRPQPANMIH